MKLTRHNGRAGKNGAYNPKHNDRSFNINNSEHIDEERAKGNIYWDCFNGYRTFYDKGNECELANTFEEAEDFIILFITKDLLKDKMNVILRIVTRNVIAPHQIS